MEASATTAIEESSAPAITGTKYADPSWAERYARYWEPVLAPAGRRLLDALAQDGLPSDAAPARPSGTKILLDVGTGTGLLALDAAQRWPGARIIGVDPSAAMVAVARKRAAGLPAADGQLVPKRLAALRETYRVLRPGRASGLRDVDQDG